jgi:hypothetical protein
MNTMATKSRTTQAAWKSARPKSAERKPWAKIIRVVIAAVLLLAGSVWAWKHYSHLARLRKAEQLLAAAAQNRGPSTNSGQRRFVPDDGTRKAIDALGLSEAEREELRKARQDEARRRREEEMERYLAMAEKDRWAYMQKTAAEMAKRFDQNAAAAAKNGQAGNASNSSRGNDQRNNANANGQGPRGPRTPDQRLQAQKWRLDNTTPQERAARTIYNNQLAKAIGQQNSIRAGQGLPPLPLPRWRF